MKKTVRGNSIYITEEMSQDRLTIHEASEGEAVYLKLEGLITSALAPGFENEVLLASVCFEKVILDCSGCTSIFSGAVQSLLQAQKYVEKRGAYFELRNVPPVVMESFVSMGYDQILEIKEN